MSSALTKIAKSCSVETSPLRSNIQVWVPHKQVAIVPTSRPCCNKYHKLMTGATRRHQWSSARRAPHFPCLELTSREEHSLVASHAVQVLPRWGAVSAPTERLLWVDMLAETLTAGRRYRRTIKDVLGTKAQTGWMLCANSLLLSFQSKNLTGDHDLSRLLAFKPPKEGITLIKTEAIDIFILQSS